VDRAGELGHLPGELPLLVRRDADHLVHAVAVELLVHELVELDVLGAPDRRARRARQEVRLEPARVVVHRREGGPGGVHELALQRRVLHDRGRHEITEQHLRVVRLVDGVLGPRARGVGELPPPGGQHPRQRAQLGERAAHRRVAERARPDEQAVGGVERVVEGRVQLLRPHGLDLEDARARVRVQQVVVHLVVEAQTGPVDGLQPVQHVAILGRGRPDFRRLVARVNRQRIGNQGRQARGRRVGRRDVRPPGGERRRRGSGQDACTRQDGDFPSSDALLHGPLR